MPKLKKILWVSTAIIAAGGVSIVASAQTSGGSPFATKKKKNAWETNAWQTAPSAPSQQSAPTTSLPLRGTGVAFEAPAPTYNNVPGYSVTPGSSSSEYIAPARLAGDNGPQKYQAPTYHDPSYVNEGLAGGSFNSSAYGNAAPVQPTNIRTQPEGPTGSAYYPGRTNKSGMPPGSVKAETGFGGYENRAPQQNYSNQGYGQNGYGARPQNSGRPNSGPMSRPQKTSWSERLGLGDVVTSVKGFLRIGAAATERDGWSEDFIADGKISGEVSAITGGGLEYGVGAEVRGQYDKYRRGFGGLVGDCPANVVGCSSVDVAGIPTAYRGHTSQFYASGPSNAKEGEIALEGAYLFLRSSYGDVTLGRDDGAAYLFSLGAPSLMAVNGSNSPVDFTGLDAVKTVNDGSGFAEKVTYVSPRLLGDNIGVGIQFGASYSPDARACGVDYCVRKNGADGTGVIAPDLKDVFEAGLSLDRTFTNGLKVEATGTYATASEDTGIAAFDDLSAYNFGFDVTYADWRMGASYLDSNNGLADGDYSAWDVGVTWKPAAWGVSASYGQSTEDNIRVKANQVVLGGVYDFDRFTLGAGVQYIERKSPIENLGVITMEKEKATAVFIQGAIDF